MIVKKSVDNVLKALNKAVKDLDEVSVNCDAEIIRRTEVVKAEQAKIAAAADEGARAQRVRDRIADLVA